jgi:hypothetical protein
LSAEEDASIDEVTDLFVGGCDAGPGPGVVIEQRGGDESEQAEQNRKACNVS